MYTYVYVCTYIYSVGDGAVFSYLDGYCSTVQGLLDWFEVDLGFTELLFIYVYVLLPEEEYRELSPLIYVHLYTYISTIYSCICTITGRGIPRAYIHIYIVTYIHI